MFRLLTRASRGTVRLELQRPQTLSLKGSNNGGWSQETDVLRSRKAPGLRKSRAVGVFRKDNSTQSVSQACGIAFEGGLVFVFTYPGGEMGVAP